VTSGDEDGGAAAKRAEFRDVTGGQGIEEEFFNSMSSKNALRRLVCEGLGGV
jgi:hypothetical protein